MRVLCVAEKPSAAKKIAEILSQNNLTTRPTGDIHVKNYSFTYNLNNRPTQFVMTALKGHLLQLIFEGGINKDWNSYPIEDVFFTPVVKEVPDNMQPLANNLQSEVRSADILFIWTDCDREGEAIGGDVADICRRVKPNITVWRAHFSAMQPNEIHQAAQHHSTLDMRQVEAVRARTELDFRIGAAFTRLQTIQLRPYFNNSDRRKVLSYGSCQFPTLGFVVDRYMQIENFIPEEFWKITMTHVQQREDTNMPPLKTSFNWRRERLFDRWACFVLYEKCFEKKVATVTKVRSKSTRKWKPLPLTTVELQKVACRVLNMSGHQIMSVAEGLYTQGLISYPRTETDQYDESFDFRSLIEKQIPDPNWGQYAQILNQGEFERPKNGRNNDKAHPPIHPTAYNPSLTGDPKRVYEFIARRFLGSCWKNAVGFETNVEITMDTEHFDAKGLVILEKNYLEVYIYDNWTGNQIPEFQEGDEFIPDTLEMQSGHTTAPRFLTEPDLIGMMEKNEIGTDATIADHIQKILDREYVFKENQYFKPLTLGIALTVGYDKIGLESSLSKPFLRRQMEADLKKICDGSITPLEVLQRSISRYEEMFHQSRCDFSKIRQAMDTYFRATDDGYHASSSGRGGRGDGSLDRGNRGGRGGRGRGRGRGRGGSNNNGDRPDGDNDDNNGHGPNPGRGSTRGMFASRRGRGSNHNSNQSSPMLNQNATRAPLCEHGKSMVIRIVKKDSPNKGREFYMCSDNDQCGTFHWADDVSDNTTTTTARSFHNTSDNNNTSRMNSIPSPLCNCGKPSVERTVVRDSANKGRSFYCCSAGKDNGCDLFEWADGSS